MPLHVPAAATATRAKKWRWWRSRWSIWPCVWQAMKPVSTVQEHDAMKHPRSDGIDPAARSRSRRRALQALYAWQLEGAPIESLLAQFPTAQAREKIGRGACRGRECE